MEKLMYKKQLMLNGIQTELLKLDKRLCNCLKEHLEQSEEMGITIDIIDSLQVDLRTFSEELSYLHNLQKEIEGEL
jgi:hypothetical protein